MPPTQSPLRFEAAILSRILSEVTSRSNYGIRFERKLCEEIELHLAYRWFCRLESRR